MSAVEWIVRLAYLVAAACFVLGLHLMNSPGTARTGNRLSAGAMVAAVAGTFVLLAEQGGIHTANWLVIGAGAAVGGVAGMYTARAIRMTAMPQLVSVFNAVGGGAAALLAVNDVLRGGLSTLSSVTGALDVLIGSVTFTGSLVAAGKLQGVVAGRPIAVRSARMASATAAAGMVVGAVWLAVAPAESAALIVLAACAAGFGITLVLPIGGADMPVVISLLNACTGTAVAMAGFVIGNDTLIIGGALVGASGGILTALMAAAMNRSIAGVLLGGFGGGDQPISSPASADTVSVRRITPEDAAIQLGYANTVIIVPGYGLAAARAQQEISDLAVELERRGIDVSFAIHPVAGRMPGHMNVLLAEADVPYPLLRGLDEANPAFAGADVALVVGANDVTNPAARRPGNPISGMPILDVDHARSVIVLKRSLGHGYAGVDNELYTDPKTAMLFADAKQGLAGVLAALKSLVG